MLYFISEPWLKAILICTIAPPKRRQFRVFTKILPGKSFLEQLIVQF